MINFSATQKHIIYQQVALLVTVQGIVDKITVRQFEKQFQDYLNTGFYFIILDCSGLQAIHNEGLQTLLKIVDMYHQAGGLFLFIKVVSEISQCLDRMGFAPIFTSFTTQEEAIHYLEEQLRKSVAEDKQSQEEAKPPHLQQNPQQMRSPTTSFDITRGKPIHYPGTSIPAPTTPTSRLEIILEVQDCFIQGPFRLTPITLHIVALKGQRNPPILHIVPYFPGCSVVPEYRALYLAAGQKTTFWITPLLSQTIPGWFELWSGEENIQQWSFPIHIASQRIARFFLTMAFIIAAIFFLSPMMTTIPNLNLPEWATIITNFLQTIPMIGISVSIGLLIISLFCYFIYRRVRIKTTQQKFIFE